MSLAYIYTPTDLSLVAQAGTHAVILGESLVKQEDVQQSVRNLLKPTAIFR